jgi:dTDP-4-dehydrorhamnose 3,5-epimerase
MADDGVLHFARRGDARGALVALEGMQQVPFEIARVYYIVGTPAGVARGHHAHRELHQMAVAVAGAVTIVMDDGQKQWHVRLDAPDKGVLIPPMVWHEMVDFSAGAVLLVLASARYDEADYIRDRAEFARLVQ